MNPLQQIPLTARKYLYLAYALVGLVLGGFQVYGTQQLGALDIGKALEVLAYIGIPFGFTAASNLQGEALPDLPDSAYPPDAVDLP